MVLFSEKQYMKASKIKKFNSVCSHAALLALLLLGACGEEASKLQQGTYTCTDCTYQAVTFQPDGVAILTTEGINFGASYEVDDDKVTVEVETAAYTFLIMSGTQLKGLGDMEGEYTRTP
jgi:hypothetical protein